MTKRNGEEKVALTLTKEERIELHNLQLQAKILEYEVRDRKTVLERAQAKFIDQINARLGTDIRQYEINLDTGDMTLHAQPKEASTN